MKATLSEQVSNGRNLSGQKELVSAKSIVVATKDGPDEVVVVRWWMGRSNQASVVYCTVWVRGDNYYTSGHGTAGGGGYHKESAAAGAAIRNAGIKLSQSIGGVGDSTVDSALYAIVKALGFKGRAIIVSH